MAKTKKKKKPRLNPREVKLANVKAALKHIKGNARVIGLVFEKLPRGVVGTLVDCLEEMQDCCARALRAASKLPATTVVMLDAAPGSTNPPKQVNGCPPPT